MRPSAFPAAVTAFTLPFLAAAALVASADEGSSGRAAGPSPLIRPPSAVLRHVDTPTASAGPEGALAPRGELVILVGGYQSCACPDDGAFDALARRLAAQPGYTVVRFGQDPRFPYDTYGAIDPSAVNLRDEIRTLGRRYDAVHIVTHSMGGVVADRAFANGLSRSDGVVTYVSWSAPHSGSDAARAIELTERLRAGMPLREGLLWLRMEADSAAVHDLARTRPSSPPAGVVRLDLREASDLLVTARDAADPGVPSRTLTRAPEGHGGILNDPDAIDLTVRTITTRRVPPDGRPRAVTIAAQVESDRVGALVFGAICVLAGIACLATVAMRLPLVGTATDGLRRFLPRPPRPLCR